MMRSLKMRSRKTEIFEVFEAIGTNTWIERFLVFSADLPIWNTSSCWTVDSLTATRSHLKALYEKNDGWCKQAWCTGSEPSDWTFSQCLHKRAALLSKFKFFFLCAAACVSLGLVVIPTGRLINLLIQIWWLLFFLVCILINSHIICMLLWQRLWVSPGLTWRQRMHSSPYELPDVEPSRPKVPEVWFGSSIDPNSDPSLIVVVLRWF